jgi:hypothetical protein
MKVGVQVAASYKGPHLEVYVDVMHVIGPEIEYPAPWRRSDQSAGVVKTRDQDVYIQFQLINIGGERAENIRVTRSGDFKRRHDDVDASGRTRSIAQMAPGRFCSSSSWISTNSTTRGRTADARAFSSAISCWTLNMTLRAEW